MLGYAALIQLVTDNIAIIGSKSFGSSLSSICMICKFAGLLHRADVSESAKFQEFHKCS